MNNTEAVRAKTFLYFQPYEISQWLQLLKTDDGFQDRAIFNWRTQGEKRYSIVGFRNALSAAFDWYQTNEGYDFWAAVSGYPWEYVQEKYWYLL
ncbi:MAG: hypothetical protein P4L51_06200 [Puia sp.]|nr:hypothetical protein [Puia sp.]